MIRSFFKMGGPKRTLQFYCFDKNLGFWGVPNQKDLVSFKMGPGTEYAFTVSHNEEGNRDAPISTRLDKPLVLCIGGSHTWGAGVEEGARYTERLQELTNFQVRNIGHCSLGLDQVCLAILDRTEKYRPQTIIVEQHPGSIHRILNHYVNGYLRPYFTLDVNGNLRLQRVQSLAKYAFFRRAIGSYLAFGKEFAEYRAGIDLSEGYSEEFDPLFIKWKTHYYMQMYALVDKILKVIQSHCMSHGVNLIFALGATKQQLALASKSDLIDYNLPRDRLIELLKKNEILYVDMLPKMLEAHSSQNPVIFEDGHINSRGHDVFARALVDILT